MILGPVQVVNGYPLLHEKLCSELIYANAGLGKGKHGSCHESSVLWLGNHWPLVSADIPPRNVCWRSLVFEDGELKRRSYSREHSGKRKITANTVFGTKRNTAVGILPKALSVFGWGYPFQTIQSMPSNMPQM